MPGRDTDTAIHIAHDLTQSVWLGGALMGAYALDTAATASDDPYERIEAVGRAWARWRRISTPVVAGHLLAGLGLTFANKGRLGAQRGGSRTVAVRSALTGLALGTELASRRLGSRIGARARPSPGAHVVDGETAALQRRLERVQWANVAAIAAMMAVGARMEEQQRPRELVRGVAARLGLAA